jgi:hypothetical protein
MGIGSGALRLERKSESSELTKTVIKAREDNVNACGGGRIWRLHLAPSVKCDKNRTRQQTRVFQLIGSTNPLMTSAISSAPTLARPTTVGSRFIHVSHAPHWRSMAGTGLVPQRFALYWAAQFDISCTMSDSSLLEIYTFQIDPFLTHRILGNPLFHVSLHCQDELHQEVKKQED